VEKPISIPFSLYSNFVVEDRHSISMISMISMSHDSARPFDSLQEKHGFNKMTAARQLGIVESSAFCGADFSAVH
jgi:hypothetical protein